MSLHLAFYPPTPRSAGMGGATVALGGVDSHNPAAWGFCEGVDAAFDYGRLNFSSGPDLDFYRGHVVFPVPGLGGYAKIMGLSLSTRQEDISHVGGGRFHLWAREFGLGYGREIPLPESIPGRLAFGFAGFPSDPSEVRATMPVEEPNGVDMAHAGGDGPLMGRQGALGYAKLGSGRGQSLIGSMRLGLLYEPTEQLAFGIQYTHILDRLTASYPGAGGIYDKDRYHVNLVTVGAAFKPDEKTVVTVQHLTGRAKGASVGGDLGNRATYDYFSMGVERQVPITEGVGIALRAGMVRGSFTCGFGAALPHGFRADYAFMSHYHHELRHSFGTGPLHIFGVGKEF